MFYALIFCLFISRISLAQDSLHDSLPLLPVPTNIPNASSVLLQCGRVYSGELNLEGKFQVTVKTEGHCGVATITRGVAVSGWRRESVTKPIWSAAISFQPAQVEVGGRFMELAHFSQTPEIWMTAVSPSPNQLLISLPNKDVIGASLVWKAHDWLILVNPIVRYASNVISIKKEAQDEFTFPPQTQFYLEGKCWMLDAPGEWCVEQGRLVVWPHDGNSPEGRTSAAVHGPAINANNADSILIDNIKIKTATIGIEANNSHHLRMHNTQFEQIGEEAIIVGGKDIHLERIQINQTGLNGLRFTDDARQIILRDSTIQGAGMLGLPKRSKGAIVLEHAEQAQIIGNTIKDSAYIGIRIFRNTVVENNHIDRACLRLTDCAGIYTFARDGLPLNSNIINNEISQTQGRFSFGIYLDDQANHVQVIKNKISNNAGGMQLHNAYSNLIQENVFFKNKNQQILFNETSAYPLMHDNHIINNNFNTDDNVPVYRLWSSLGEKSIHNFGVYKANTYYGVKNKFAECAGSGMIAWKNWKERMQDTSLFQFSVNK